jgi:hypothetical protein
MKKVKVLLGQKQADALLTAAGVGIDNMQSEIDHGETMWERADVDEAMAAFRRVSDALDEAREIDQRVY